MSLRCWDLSIRARATEKEAHQGKIARLPICQWEIRFSDQLKGLKMSLSYSSLTA